MITDQTRYRLFISVCLPVIAVMMLFPACRKESSATGRAVPVSSPHIKKLMAGALEQTSQTRIYDPRYERIAYPGGDVPIERGVCADVIIRAFRSAGVDLQKDVHEDMVMNFSKYPNRWGLKKPDSNIDHRRVANLMTYYTRHGKSIDISRNKEKYLPGDVVAWRFDNGLLHIGLVTNIVSPVSGQNMIVHNVGDGARLEDVLFGWTVIGHYRYFQGG